jgi:hypothetical protein
MYILFNETENYRCYVVFIAIVLLMFILIESKTYLVLAVKYL